MDRRDFVQHVATVALGATVVAGLDIDRLITLLPHTDLTGIRHVGGSATRTPPSGRCRCCTTPWTTSAPTTPRPRALYLPDRAGDADTAVTLGHQAVDAVTAVSSPRAHNRLRVLNTVLEPLHTSAGVAELRDRLTTTAV